MIQWCIFNFITAVAHLDRIQLQHTVSDVMITCMYDISILIQHAGYYVHGRPSDIVNYSTVNMGILPNTGPYLPDFCSRVQANDDPDIGGESRGNPFENIRRVLTLYLRSNEQDIQQKQ